MPVVIKNVYLSQIQYMRKSLKLLFSAFHILDKLCLSNVNNIINIIKSKK